MFRDNWVGDLLTLAGMGLMYYAGRKEGYQQTAQEVREKQMSDEIAFLRKELENLKKGIQVE